MTLLSPFWHFRQWRVAKDTLVDLYGFPLLIERYTLYTSTRCLAPLSISQFYDYFGQLHWTVS